MLYLLYFLLEIQKFLVQGFPGGTLHSLCFKSNTVKKRLVSHFENFLVVAQRCLAVAYFPKKRDQSRCLIFLKNSIVVAYCLFDYELVRQKIRGEYVTGWHTGEIMYFNTKLQEYFVTFDEKNAAFS